jgi:hypothetical protein
MPHLEAIYLDDLTAARDSEMTSRLALVTPALAFVRGRDNLRSIIEPSAPREPWNR